jgi:hypothetical protein
MRALTKAMRTRKIRDLAILMSARIIRAIRLPKTTKFHGFYNYMSC